MSDRVAAKRAINALLKAVLVSGMGVSVIVAPNSAQLFVPLLKRFDSNKRAAQFKEMAYYMKRKDLILYRLLPDGSYEIRLTREGKMRAEGAEFDELIIPTPGTWDGIWHLVLFDIPERQRKARNALTGKLKQLGFYQLQKSAWVHPYPCEPIVSQVRAAFAIRPQSVVCSELRAIDRQAVLKRHFKLP